MSYALPPPNEPLLRQITESKWESGKNYLVTSNATRYVVYKTEDYVYVVVKLDGHVYRLIHHNGDIHVC